MQTKCTFNDLLLVDGWLANDSVLVECTLTVPMLRGHTPNDQALVHSANPIIQRLYNIQDTLQCYQDFYKVSLLQAHSYRHYNTRSNGPLSGTIYAESRTALDKNWSCIHFVLWRTNHIYIYNVYNVMYISSMNI